MSKVDVGVGEEFPVDDGDANRNAGAQGPQNEADERAEFDAWKRRRDAERQYYEERRRHRAEWHQRKREFKERIRAAAREFGQDYDDRDWRDHRWHGMRFWPIGVGIALVVLAIPVLILALFFSLISAAFKAPFVILAIVAIAALFFVLHHRHGHYHYRFASHGHGRRYYYDSDIETPPRPQQQPPQPPKQAPIITPPPAGN